MCESANRGAGRPTLFVFCFTHQDTGKGLVATGFDAITTLQSLLGGVATARSTTKDIQWADGWTTRCVLTTHGGSTPKQTFLASTLFSTKKRRKAKKVTNNFGMRVAWSKEKEDEEVSSEQNVLHSH